MTFCVTAWVLLMVANGNRCFAYTHQVIGLFGRYSDIGTRDIMHVLIIYVCNCFEEFAAGLSFELYQCYMQRIS